MGVPEKIKEYEKQSSCFEKAPCPEMEVLEVMIFGRTDGTKFICMVPDIEVVK